MNAIVVLLALLLVAAVWEIVKLHRILRALDARLIDRFRAMDVRLRSVELANDRIDAQAGKMAADVRAAKAQQDARNAAEKDAAGHGRFEYPLLEHMPWLTRCGAGQRNTPEDKP